MNWIFQYYIWDYLLVCSAVKLHTQTLVKKTAVFHLVVLLFRKSGLLLEKLYNTLIMFRWHAVFGTIDLYSEQLHTASSRKHPVMNIPALPFCSLICIYSIHESYFENRHLVFGHNLDWFTEYAMFDDSVGTLTDVSIFHGQLRASLPWFTAANTLLLSLL